MSNVKKKLLIALGCSFTEGVGNWDFDNIPDGINVFDSKDEPGDLYDEWYRKSLYNFHKLAWPNKLGKKLGFNQVINLGLGGSSTSGQVKQFIEKYSDEDFSEWDVTIIWLMTEPSRISFFIKGINRDMSVSAPYDESNHNEIFNVYYKTLLESNDNSIDGVDLDLILEQIFYYKIIQTICNSKGYRFFAFNYDPRNSKLFHKVYSTKYGNSEHFIGSDIRKPREGSVHWRFNPGTLFRHTEEIMENKICGHPTPEGYDVYVENMIEDILKVDSSMMSPNPPHKMHWRWDGYPSLASFTSKDIQVTRDPLIEYHFDETVKTTSVGTI